MQGFRSESRGMTALHASMFAMSAGFYIILPLLGNELINARGIPVATVTLILNVRIFAQDLLMLPAGFLSDRMGPRNALALGAFCRGTGFLIMAFARSVPLLLVAGLLAGLGGSFFFPACLSLYTAMTNEGNRLRVFSIREVLNSLGNLAGPLVGTALLVLSFRHVGIVAALVFFTSGTAVLVMVGNPHRDVQAEARRPVNFRRVMGDKRFLWFSVLLMLATVYMNQQMIAIPVRVNQLDPTYAYVGIIFSVSSIVMIVLQLPLTRLASSLFSQYHIVAVAMAFYTAGLTLIGLGGGIWALYVGSIVYNFGTLLLQPAKNILIASYAPAGMAGSYFGCQGFVNTIGNVFLSTGLGVLYELSDRPQFALLPWLSLLVVGAVTVLLIAASEKRLAPAAPDSQ